MNKYVRSVLPVAVAAPLVALGLGASAADAATRIVPAVTTCTSNTVHVTLNSGGNICYGEGSYSLSITDVFDIYDGSNVCVTKMTVDGKTYSNVAPAPGDAVLTYPVGSTYTVTYLQIIGCAST
ncbi:MAG TPA: hypothetical protein VL551_24895 [Actinospica sp.]|jgi:hypothetical protein|nr:hypothetical protein [Actinospica sp.]